MGFGVTYEGLKPFIVSLAPRIAEVLELPMRVWNLVHVHTQFSLALGFGVTYEGLKLHRLRQAIMEVSSFGVTYEGLKLVIDTLFDGSHGGFGVTYEGLKLGSANPPKQRMPDVLELPMRVWNILSSMAHMEHTFVLELPMRVWNAPSPRNYRPAGRFWSYLWGFET